MRVSSPTMCRLPIQMYHRNDLERSDKSKMQSRPNVIATLNWNFEICVCKFLHNIIQAVNLDPQNLWGY